MKRKTIVIVLIILVVALLSACKNSPAGSQAPESNPQQPFGTEESLLEPERTPGEEEESTSDKSTEEDPDKIVAPAFTVYDAEGNPVALSDFLGKPVVLNFWASWCGPCKGEMPDFQDVYAELGEEVHFLIVNLTDGERETVQTASDFIASQGYTFPVYYDTTSEAAYAYGIRSIPTTFFIDAEGYAIAQASGAIDAATLQRGIDMIYPDPVSE